MSDPRMGLDDELLHPRNVRVGDLTLGYEYRGRLWPWDLCSAGTNAIQVTKIEDFIIWSDDRALIDFWIGIGASALIWVRKNSKSSNDDRFPHRCPMCGGAAYVGLSTIEHRDGGCRT